MWIGSIFLFVGCSTDEDTSPNKTLNDEQSLTARAMLADGQILELPSFSFTDQTNSRFGSSQLDGKVWIAHLMFSRCENICPDVITELALLQDEFRLSNNWQDIRIVSFSVDADYDTPSLLQEHARRSNADQNQWKFLTARQNQLWQFSNHALHLPVTSDSTLDEIIFPRQDLVLIDRNRRIHGIYDALDPNSRQALASALSELVDVAPLPIIAHPETIADPPGLEQRRRTQLDTVDQFEIFYAFQFEDRALDSGITFVNRVTEDSGKAYKPVHYDHGNGISVADVDGDHLLDVYFTNQIGSNELWRNLGDGQFENITHSSGVGLPDKISVTASFADTDNDGDADLYVTTVRGGNHLFINAGNGIFSDVTDSAGLGYVGHSSSAVFFDYNRDGLLDLFLCNVGVYTSDEIGPGGYFVGLSDAFEGHLQPEQRNESSILYENLGNNQFSDVTEERGLIDESWSGDASPIDVNGDLWPDLYVLNMQGHDQYFENVGGEYFERKSRDLFPNTPWGSMSIKVFDFDNDTDMDIIISDMHSDMSEDISSERETLKSRMQWPESTLQSGGTSIYGNAFFQNNGDGTFSEVSDDLGTENYWPWGLSVGDLNADGFTDIFIASSMNFPFRYGVNSVLLNNRGKSFLDSEFILGIEPRRDQRTAKPWFTLDCAATDQANPYCEEFGLLEQTSIWGSVGTRSSAIFDLEGDGDLDIVTNEFHDGPMVLISNLTEQTSVRYLAIELVGTQSNRNGVGATVTLRAGDRSQVMTQDGQSGYLSQSVMPLYFGLGNANSVDEIIVAWPSGDRQVISGPFEENSTIRIREGEE